MLDLAPGKYFIVSRFASWSVWQFEQTASLFGRAGIDVKCDVRKRSVQTPDYEFRFTDAYSFYRKQLDGCRYTVIYDEEYEIILDKAIWDLEEKFKFKTL